MKILVVLAHPNKTSFNHAIKDSVVEGLTGADHQVQVADLNAEGFQPAMIPDDFAQFQDKPMPADVQAEQDRVEWSDAMIFVFPMWWWAMPAMLKGWIDRVMTYGWAWLDPARPDISPMKKRKVLVFCTTGFSAEALAKRGYDTAFDTQLKTGVFDYCGLENAQIEFFHQIDTSTPKERQTYLARARGIAAEFGHE